MPVVIADVYFVRFCLRPDRRRSKCVRSHVECRCIAVCAALYPAGVPQSLCSWCWTQWQVASDLQKARCNTELYCP